MKTILVDAWNTLVTENGINEELKVLLDSFPNRKIILTNANNDECISYGIVNMPYEVFSLAHNPNKDSNEYYLKMLKYFNLKSNEVVYFEHNLDAVNSAQSVNIKTYHLKKNKNIKGLTFFLKENL